MSTLIQWELGITDTQGTVKNCLNPKVVSFLRFISMYLIGSVAEVHVAVPISQGGLKDRFHCTCTLCTLEIGVCAPEVVCTLEGRHCEKIAKGHQRTVNLNRFIQRSWLGVSYVELCQIFNMKGAVV